MSPRNRNLITGLVVLIALGVLTWMVLTFSGRAAGLLKPKGTPIVFLSERGDGLNDGSPVLYRGVQVGKVTGVRRTDDNTHVRISAEVDNRPPLPHNLSGQIRAQSALGSSSQVELELKGAPQGQLAQGDEVELKYVGLSLLPPEVSDVLSTVQRQKLVEHVDETIQELRRQVTKAGRVMDDVNQLIGDPKLQADFRASVANVRSATERADRIGANLETLTTNASATMGEVRTAVAKTNADVDRVSRQMGDDLDKLGQVFRQFQEISEKVNKGHGTAGALVNDPKLYDELTDTARELNVVAASLARLVDQWEHEGVSLKVGGK